MTDEQVKHLELIQGVIARMQRSSFILKGLSVTLTSAIFALATNASAPRLVPIALLPALIFWLLDGYYLYQERLFRKLYDDVRQGTHAGGPFAMSTSAYKDTMGWPQAALSPTVLLFHGAVVLAVVLGLIVLN